MMDEYNDFTYEPEEIETELKSEEIRKLNQDSSGNKNNNTRKQSKSSMSNHTNNINPKSNNGNINGYINNTLIPKQSISNHNNTTEQYQKEFDINYSKDIKEIERQLVDNMTKTPISNNNTTTINPQDLDTERLDRLIENVLNNNEPSHNDNNKSSISQSKTPKANRTKSPIEIDPKGLKTNDNINLFNKTQPHDNNNQINLQHKRLKSASLLLNKSYSKTNTRLRHQSKEDSYQLLSNELEILIQTPAKSASQLSEQNQSMIHYLSKLNAILSKQINLNTKPYHNLNQNQHHPSAMLHSQLKQKRIKAISIYQREYFKLEARLKQISDENYEVKLQERLTQLKKDISYYESENQKLKQSHKASEVLISSQTKLISNSTIELRRLEMDYEQIQRQHSQLMDKIARNKEIITDNERKISQLKEYSQNMQTSAKETYGIVSFDNVNDIQMKNEENNRRKRQLEKNYEVLEKAMMSNKKKYESEIGKNERMIYMLKKTKLELQIELSKAEEGQIQREGSQLPIERKVGIKGDKCEVYSIVKDKAIESGNEGVVLPEIKKSLPNVNTNVDNNNKVIEGIAINKDVNPLRISKDKVIEELEKKVELKTKESKEKPIESLNNNNGPSSISHSTTNIIGKNVLNKPSFAFTQIKKEDIRLTNSIAPRRDFIISDISEIQNNTNNNNPSDSNKEIIEEINIESNNKRTGSGKDNQYYQQKSDLLLNDTVPEFLRDLKENINQIEEHHNSIKEDKKTDDNQIEPYWLKDNKEEIKTEEVKEEEEAQGQDKAIDSVQCKEEEHTEVLNKDLNETNKKEEGSHISKNNGIQPTSDFIDEVIELAEIPNLSQDKAFERKTDSKKQDTIKHNTSPHNTITTIKKNSNSNRDISSMNNNNNSEEDKQSKKSKNKAIDKALGIDNEFEDLEEFQI